MDDQKKVKVVNIITLFSIGGATETVVSMAEGLNKIGARAKVTEDGMILEGVETLNGGEVNGYGDHRIVMALSMLCLKGYTVQFDQVNCVSKSCPDFFRAFISDVTLFLFALRLSDSCSSFLYCSSICKSSSTRGNKCSLYFFLIFSLTSSGFALTNLMSSIHFT